jgi:D-arginine dehydrogenase
LESFSELAMMGANRIAPMSSHTFDFIVIGAGIAGASAAASLARRGSIALIEGEDHAGYHTTGRSAALFSAIYGNAAIRALTRASRSFFEQPPAAFAPAALVRPRPTLYFATADQVATLERFRADPDIAAATERLDAARTNALVPVFRAGYIAGSALETDSADIDVDQLHQGFLRAVKAQGGRVLLSKRVTRIAREGSSWAVDAGDMRLAAPVVVNAAGAWGDEVAALAGVAPVGLQPMRRTALLVDPPKDVDTANWPAAIDIDERFYFKPDAGMLLLSPADESPSPPCDAQPEEIDVAIAVDRFEQATGLAVRRVTHQWAGLRVFTPDRTPVVGFDPGADGFFWLVGQGGYGIQTAPAMGELAGALAAREDVPAALRREGVDAAALSPQRFRNA